MSNPITKEAFAEFSKHFSEYKATEEPDRFWVGLTDDEILKIYSKPCGSNYIDYAKAIEAKLKEKNT